MDAPDLDDVRALAKFDSGRMLDLLERLPDQLAQAWRAGLDWPIPTSLRRPSRIVIAGMGGSAIGAEVVTKVASALTTVPLEVVRGYVAPTFDADTLLVGCSFSGDTAETLAAVADAEPHGMRLVVSAGGALTEMARARSWPLFRVPFNGPPRAAFGWMTMPLFAILCRLGAVPMEEGTVEQTIAELGRHATMLHPRATGEMNEAKRLARGIAGSPAVIIGAGPLEVAARRWAAQLNENAKQWAVAAALPEANHNLLVALAGGVTRADQQPIAILIDAPALDARVTRQVELTTQMLDESGVRQLRVQLRADTTLSAVLEACQLGDWVSLYTAALNGVDPFPVDPLKRVKASLAK